MNEPISVSNAEHYVWGNVCDGWHLLRGESLSVIEELMPPATEELRHFHTRSRQFFYVLEGELTMEVEGHLYPLLARQGLEIAPGQPHQALNRSGSSARFLVISQPPSHGDRQPA
ncbi:MAG TPA: cupin domain-containing protein [Silvibacterium sp.]|jgi:mannose-6-phosphate isomerase-like protein (cupin superfamily)|nr:cupin domain-containing protein [Silvibacterium sp.]